MKRKICFVVMLCLIMLISMIGCGSNSIVGTYVGQAGTLKLSEDGEWWYFQDNWMEDTDWRGSYKKAEGKTYELECEDVTLYADVEEEGELFVYSPDPDWGSETFRKVSSEVDMNSVEDAETE